MYKPYMLRKKNTHDSTEILLQGPMNKLIYSTNSVTHLSVRVSVCSPTPPKLLGVLVRNLAQICIFNLRMFCTGFYDRDLKVKVTARTKM